METMTYRGYTARVAFDERDGIFVGRVIDRPAVISFHGRDGPELRSAFEDAVDACVADGLEEAARG